MAARQARAAEEAARRDEARRQALSARAETKALGRERARARAADESARIKESMDTASQEQAERERATREAIERNDALIAAEHEAKQLEQTRRIEDARRKTDSRRKRNSHRAPKHKITATTASTNTPLSVEPARTPDPKPARLPATTTQHRSIRKPPHSPSLLHRPSRAHCPLRYRPTPSRQQARSAHTDIRRMKCSPTLG